MSIPNLRDSLSVSREKAYFSSERVGATHAPGIVKKTRKVDSGLSGAPSALLE